MTATVLPLPPRRIPRRLGPVPVGIAGSQVRPGARGPLLELRLVLRVDAVPPAQRRALAGLLRSGGPFALCLVTAMGGTRRVAGWRMRQNRTQRTTGARERVKGYPGSGVPR